MSRRSGIVFVFFFIAEVEKSKSRNHDQSDDEQRPISLGNKKENSGGKDGYNGYKTEKAMSPSAITVRPYLAFFGEHHIPL